MKLIFTGLIFLMIIILHIIAIVFIIKKFLKIDEATMKNSPASIVTGDISVILNSVIGLVALFVAVHGLWLIAYPRISNKPTLFSNYALNQTIYICNFIKGLLFLESAIFLPYGLNLLLYKLWYKKTGLSKWKIFPSIIIGIGNFILCVFIMILGDLINDWATWPWMWK